MRLPSADFEPRASFLYRQVPTYTALYSSKSTIMRRPPRRDVPSYTALYPALRRKRPPRKPLAGHQKREEHPCSFM